MKLELPDHLSHSTARSHFEQAPFAGQTVKARIFVCSNPACDCREISFESCEIESRRSDRRPAQGNLSFTLDLRQRKLADKKDFPTAAKAVVLGEAVVRESAGSLAGGPAGSRRGGRKTALPIALLVSASERHPRADRRATATGPTEDRTQRSVSLRQRQEVQEMLRRRLRTETRSSG